MVEAQDLKEKERKEIWLKELTNFIVEANLNTWATDGGKLPDEDGFKRHRYARGPWRLEDKYTGYFKAPGFTTVYFKDKPTWMMTYGGSGQTEGFEDIAKLTFDFLKRALLEVRPELPYRGPREFVEGEWKYNFDFIFPHGIGTDSLTEFLAQEDIYKGEDIVFEQTIMGGIIVGKDENRKPIYPWNL